ncbi:MAG: TonB-dependent receptor [Novosphingobium sp.]|nr:TonB-dependent receptor [Novosphingobium sp.]MBO9601684.1 TonB-dependent receptor [Novosphingobium sp.]
MKIQSRLKGAVAPIALSVALIAQPAFAQDDDDKTPAPAASVSPDDLATTQTSKEDEGDSIVVTGSRIRRSEFNNPDPITIVSPQMAAAQGQMTAAQMLQSSPIAAGSAQVTSAISAVFNTNGGLGAETISLRGLGANRTLVLLNGRRAGPSGTRGGVSSFDLNALPTSIIDNVEILKTGASSVYGSDAVAGVVNIITKKDTDGLELDGFISQPFKSGGEEYRLSGTWGKDFGNGHILATVDYYKQAMLRRRDRKYLDCPEEYIFDAQGNRADIIDPRTGAPRCDDYLWGQVWTYDYEFRQSGLYQYDYDGSLAQYLGVNAVRDPVSGSQLGVPAGFYRVSDESPKYPLPGGLAYQRLAQGLENAYHPFQAKQSVIPESELYTAYVEGSYDVSDNLTIGTELLYNKRKTYYDSYGQFYYLTGYTQNFDGSGFGDPYSPGWSGEFFLSPTAITDHNDTRVDVDYYRGVLWADGKFGDFLPKWTYTAYFQYSKSKGAYNNDIIYNDAVDIANYRTDTCAGATFSGGRQCVDIDWTQPDFLAGDLSPEEQAFLYGQDIGHTTYDEMIGEVSVSGPIVTLPAGDLQIAAGVDGRWDKINDTPGLETLTGNVWGASTSGVTAGKSATLEAFGEVEIPVIHDTPLIKAFTLSGSGRVTNVKGTRASDGFSASSNGNWTYSVGASWEVTDWLQFRARYGTSFRYPALFELFLADQTGFLSQRAIDPCINLDSNPTVNDRVRANCLAGIPGKLPGVEGDHPGGGVEATIITQGGIGVLDPETSTAKTFSVILRPRFGGGTRLNVAVDYYDIRIKGEVASLGAANIIYGCYNSQFFPNEPLCDLFTRNVTGAGINNIAEVEDKYLNVNKQRSEGLDVTIDATQDVGKFGELQFLAQMNWQFTAEQALFEGTSIDNNGEVGDPKWVGDFKLVWRPNDDWQLFYGVEVVGKSSNEQDYLDEYGSLCRTDVAVYGDYCVVVKTPTVFYHSISLTRNFKNFEITGGIANLFNTAPPRVTVSGGNSMNGGVIQTVGQSPLVSQYDYYGIRGFLSVKAKF